MDAELYSKLVPQVFCMLRYYMHAISIKNIRQKTTVSKTLRVVKLQTDSQKVDDSEHINELQKIHFLKTTVGNFQTSQHWVPVKSRSLD